MNAKAQAMTESAYRKLAQEAYNRIEAQFEEIDPDAVECEVAQGALTLTLPDGARWVLSQQPPVRQMWLAVASKGRAFHFDYDASTGRWLDDRGEGVELLGYLEQLLDEVAGLQVKF